MPAEPDASRAAEPGPGATAADLADATAADLAERLLSGDRSAVPTALNLVDDLRPAERARARGLLDALQRRRDALLAHRVGITGAPGAGKSTLLDALVRHLRPQGRSIGILAIDPSSRRTGGALLGDRFRVRAGAGDDGVFLRSMAARGRLGGLADATASSIEILSAVFDWVFVETVGVGQSESEIEKLVDTLVFVAQPDAGDTLQFMKAGILELPDVFLVNKCDLGAPAARTARELAAGLDLATARSDDWKPPVLLASARDGRGIPELVETLERHRRHAAASGALEERRLEGRVHCTLQALLARYGSFGLEHAGGPPAVASHVREAEASSVASLVDVLSARIEDALAKPAKPGGGTAPERTG